MLYYILTFSLGFSLGALFMGTVKFFLSDKHMADLRAEQGDIDVSEFGQKDQYQRKRRIIYASFLYSIFIPKITIIISREEHSND